MFGDAITGIKGFFGGQTPPIPSPQQQYEARPRPPLPPPPMQYTIQGGDTLSQIAQRLGVSADDLARINTIQNPHMIRAGQVLNYPSTQSPDANESLVQAQQNSKMVWDDYRKAVKRKNSREEQVRKKDMISVKPKEAFGAPPLDVMEPDTEAMLNGAPGAFDWLNPMAGSYDPTQNTDLEPKKVKEIATEPDMSHLTGIRDQNGTLTVNQLGARLHTDHPNLSKAQMQVPATLGNNNPIGILVGDGFINWDGLTQRGQDRKGHKHSMYQFITPEYGARAAARNIRTQGRTGKASTYGGFVNLLKSRDKKLGKGYDKFVADKLGVKVTDTFNYEDDQSLADFLEVFANYESGSYETKNKHVQKWPRGVIETGILMERR